jgi:hypothetical protein
MSKRRSGGDETWQRLREWTRGQKEAERLTAHVLRVEGYVSIDPSHPLGGRDGLKDVICERHGKNWIGAAYFPRGVKKFTDVANKFKKDLAGVKTNSVDGIVFVTNQELTLGQRTQLNSLASDVESDLFHLERVANILDTPICYGIRLEYLDIEMSKEEQLSFIATINMSLEAFQNQLSRIEKRLELSQNGKELSLKEINEFQAILRNITNPFSYGLGGAISDLRVPLNELEEFRAILADITSPFSHGLGGAISDLRVPLNELKEFQALLESITKSMGIGTMRELQVPIDQLHAYNRMLDDITKKWRDIKTLSKNELQEKT